MGATIMLLATGNVWAQLATPGVQTGIPGCGPSGNTPSKCSSPEIDAASGGAAIALLTGVILLIRKGRKSKTDEAKSDE